MPKYMVINAATDYEAFNTITDIEFFFKHNIVEANSAKEAILINKYGTTNIKEITRMYDNAKICDSIIDCFVIEVNSSYLVSTPETFADLFKEIHNIQQAKLDDAERKEYDRLKKKFG